LAEIVMTRGSKPRLTIQVEQEDPMAAHLLVMYPMPKDPKTFDRRYREEHLPYAGPRLVGATGVVSKRVTSPAPGAPQFYAISDVTFPSVAELQACAASQSGKEALQHAASISTGGPPVILLATDDLVAS
jgi:uncharacterized protein (TIGR02118 family)